MLNELIQQLQREGIGYSLARRDQFEKIINVLKSSTPQEFSEVIDALTSAEANPRFVTKFLDELAFQVVRDIRANSLDINLLLHLCYLGHTQPLDTLNVWKELDEEEINILAQIDPSILNKKPVCEITLDSVKDEKLSVQEIFTKIDPFPKILLDLDFLNALLPKIENSGLLTRLLRSLGSRTIKAGPERRLALEIISEYIFQKELQICIPHSDFDDPKKIVAEIIRIKPVLLKQLDIHFKKSNSAKEFLTKLLSECLSFLDLVTAQPMLLVGFGADVLTGVFRLFPQLIEPYFSCDEIVKQMQLDSSGHFSNSDIISLVSSYPKAALIFTQNGHAHRMYEHDTFNLIFEVFNRQIESSNERETVMLEGIRKNEQLTQIHLEFTPGISFKNLAQIIRTKPKVQYIGILIDGSNAKQEALQLFFESVVQFSDVSLMICFSTHFLDVTSEQSVGQYQECLKYIINVLKNNKFPIAYIQTPLLDNDNFINHFDETENLKEITRKSSLDIIRALSKNTTVHKLYLPNFNIWPEFEFFDELRKMLSVNFTLREINFSCFSGRSQYLAEPPLLYADVFEEMIQPRLERNFKTYADSLVLAYAIRVLNVLEFYIQWNTLPKELFCDIAVLAQLVKRTRDRYTGAENHNPPIFDVKPIPSVAFESMSRMAALMLSCLEKDEHEVSKIQSILYNFITKIIIDMKNNFKEVNVQRQLSGTLSLSERRHLMACLFDYEELEEYVTLYLENKKAHLDSETSKAVKTQFDILDEYIRGLKEDMMSPMLLPIWLSDDNTLQKLKESYPDFVDVIKGQKLRFDRSMSSIKFVPPQRGFWGKPLEFLKPILTVDSDPMIPPPPAAHPQGVSKSMNVYRNQNTLSVESPLKPAEVPQAERTETNLHP